MTCPWCPQEDPGPHYYYCRTTGQMSVEAAAGFVASDRADELSKLITADQLADLNLAAAVFRSPDAPRPTSWGSMSYRCRLDEHDNCRVPRRWCKCSCHPKPERPPAPANADRDLSQQAPKRKGRLLGRRVSVGWSQRRGFLPAPSVSDAPETPESIVRAAAEAALRLTKGGAPRGGDRGRLR